MDLRSIYLETPRLVLRDHVESDLATQHALLSDNVAMRYLPDLMTDTLEGSRMNLMEAMAEIGKPGCKRVFLRIEERYTREYIGEIGYTVTEELPIGRIANAGYFIRAICWGKGYVTEALAAILRYAFTKGGVYRMTAGCLRENAGSERVMQKCGMILEGVFPRAQWHENQMKDRVQYRLLIDEWRALHSALK